jgi:putative CocE/NonD family hydrolase
VIEEQGVAIPMRDGVMLRADIYRPDGDAPVAAVLNRTPYDRSRRLTPPAALDPELATGAGFALVCQDVRGRFASDGDFYPFRDEAHDGYDTVEWVAGQPWCTGRVAMAGRSYSAATQWLAAAERPPHLAAIFPIVSGNSLYDGWVYQGGAFQFGFNLFWIQLMTPRARGSLTDQFRHLPISDPPLAGGPAGHYYRDWLAHQCDDDYWSQHVIAGHHAEVTVPAYIVGGWYDLFLKGTLENYRALRDDGGSPAARAGTRLLVGPWAHGSTYGQFPDKKFGVFGGADEIDVAQLQIDFYRRHCAPADAPDPGEAPVRLFVMGENRWREEADWPLARARSTPWFLHSAGDAAAAGGGALSTVPPDDEPPDAYVYDPTDPAPTIGGPASLPGRVLQTNAGPLDQRPLEGRPDMLVYSSAPLAEPLEVTGPLVVVLHAATSGPDTDFVAKLCDVEPDGTSRILAEGIRRGRFVGGFDGPRPLEPGRAYEYRIDLAATSNLFLPGHVIRLLVTSSSFPRFDRNANTGRRLGEDGPEDLVPADQQVFHDRLRPSHVVLPIVDRPDLAQTS